MVLNLFRAVAHFKGAQIFVAHFKGAQIFVAHFHKKFDVIITMALGYALVIMAVKLISKKKDPCPSSAEDGQFTTRK